MFALVATYAVVLVAGHVLNGFMCWLIHLAQHKPLFGARFAELHRRAHHARRDERVASHEVAIGHFLWAAGIGGGCAVYVAILPGWIAWLWVGDAFALTVGLYWLHTEYTSRASVLARFAWFRRCRAWHELHHTRTGDFSAGCNYAIGGPFVGMFPDRVCGTFAALVSEVRR